jgi:hypothetical protein
VDEGYRHAVAVDHGEIDGIAAGRRRGRQLYSVCKGRSAGKLARKALSSSDDVPTRRTPITTCTRTA